MRYAICFPLIATLAMASALPASAQGRLASAKSLRCTFARNATGSWTKDGSADVVLKPSTLVLRYDSINVDDATAQLKTGSVSSEVVVEDGRGLRALHAGVSHRAALCHDGVRKDANGRLKAVHSRHEYFAVPLAGATSSPEQDYGECEGRELNSKPRRHEETDLRGYFSSENCWMNCRARRRLRWFCGVSGASRRYSRNCFADSSYLASRRNSSPRL